MVPRDHVAAAAWIVHQNWLTDPRVTPGTRNAPVKDAYVDTTVFERYEGCGTPSTSQGPRSLYPPRLATSTLLLIVAGLLISAIALRLLSHRPLAHQVGSPSARTTKARPAGPAVDPRSPLRRALG